jgi:GTP-binding protein
VGDLFPQVQKAYAAAMRELPTPGLTKILEQAVQEHQPPLVHGRRIKLRYAHQGGRNPPVIVIHGNQTERVPETYRRYLVNAFRSAMHLTGTPVRIEFKTGSNPYKGRRNKLTPRQVKRKGRLMRHVKKKR